MKALLNESHMRASILNTERLASETLCRVGTGGSRGHVGHTECPPWEELSSADLAYPFTRSKKCNLTATRVELLAFRGPVGMNALAGDAFAKQVQCQCMGGRIRIRWRVGSLTPAQAYSLALLQSMGIIPRICCTRP